MKIERLRQPKQESAVGVQNLLRTKLFYSTIISMIAGIIMIAAPNIFNILERSYPSNKDNLNDIEAIIINVCGVLATAGGGAALHDRMTNQNRVYTPKYLPGLNIEDILEDYYG